MDHMGIEFICLFGERFRNREGFFKSNVGQLLLPSKK